MILKTITLLFILFSSFLTQAQSSSIFPQPSNISFGDGSFYFKDLLAISKRDLPSFLRDDLKWYVTHDLGVNVVFTYDGGDILFQRLMNVPEDHYSIQVSSKITIKYSSDASLFYAMQSLKQLIVKEEETISIPYCSISDEPKFQWRGMHLDVSRHFFTVDEVKQYLDWMARYKFNRFHWHLTDDQGWRIEIKKYPKLTEIGSVRAKTLVGHAGNTPEKYDNIVEKGFYTQEEIKAIVQYAKSKFIEVVPEIEMPGHARAALAAYPQYSCDGKQLPVAEKWGVFDEVFCSKDETIDFLQDILSEVVELFPSEYIHIGGDEAPKTKWKACDNCQRQINQNGLKDEAELQSYFIQQMGNFLNEKGRKLIGWDEILEGGLAANATVMSWRGTKGGIEAANEDHTVVMTPGSHCYFDHYQSDRNTEPLAIGGYTPLDKVYSFNPIPEELSKDKQALILGAQANVWTEYMPHFDQVLYMILPRMVALSEVLWGTNKEYSDFLARLKKFEIPYYRQMSTPFSNAAFYMQSKIESTPEGIRVTFFSDDKENQIIGSDPVGKNVKRLSETQFLIQPTEKLTESKVSASKMSGFTVDDLSLTMWQHSTLGKEWKLDPQPSSFYAGNSGYTLSDGIRGSRPWNGKEWLGFDNGEVQLEMNFAAKKKINTLTVSCLKANSSWIYLPESITVLFSKNGRRWKEKKIEVGEELSVILISKKAKHFKIKVIPMDIIPDGKSGAGHKPWLFMDEIWIE